MRVAGAGRLDLAPVADLAEILEQGVGHLHGHATEVRNEVSTRLVASETTLGTLVGVLTAERQHVAAVRTPVGGDVGVGLEAVRDTVVDLLLISLPVGSGFGDTLGDDLGVAPLVTGVSTVLALVTFSGEKQFTTQSTHYGLVELALNELVAVHLMHVTLAFLDGTLTTESLIRATPSTGVVLD